MITNSNISQELLEAVERYCNGTMPAEELQNFEARLAADSDFKTTVDDIRTLLLGIEAQSLKEQLDDFHQDLPILLDTEDSNPKVRFLNFRRVAIAAMMVVSLGTIWYFMGSSNDRLYNQYYSPDPGLPTTMGSSDNFEFYDAMVDYKMGDYKKAIAKWTVLHDKAPKNDTITYFLGTAYLANDMVDKAIPLLKDVAITDESAFQNEAHYYLGFAYLKKEDIPLARENFERSTMEHSKVVLEKLKD